MQVSGRRPSSRPVVRSGRPADTPATGSTQRRLFGREVQVQRLKALLADDQPGVVTVTGPGGIGKSAILRAACRALRGTCGARTVTATPETIEALGSQQHEFHDGIPPRSEQDMVPAPPSGFSSRELVIVDPADDLQAAVAELTASSPTRRIVACAIRPLGLPGERRVRIGPLPTVDPDAEPDVIAASPGVQLFLATAPDLGRPAHDEVQAIAAICHQLAGWPLAIELAAGRTELLRPTALAELLAERPDVIFEPVPVPADPTRLMPSLRAAFDRTWRRLTTSERAALRAASQFAGSFNVFQLADVTGTTSGNTMSALTELGTMYLVEPDETRDGRFVLALPVRQYARRTFGRSAPQRPVRSRYMDVVRAAVRSSAAQYLSGDESAAMRAIGDVGAELVPVFDLLLSSGAVDDAVQFAGDLAPGLVQSGQFDLVADRVDALLRRADLPAGPALAAALVGFSDAAFTGRNGGDRAELASDRLWRGVAMARESADPLTLLWALSVAVRAWPVLRDPDVAAKVTSEGCRLARQVGEPGWLARFEAWSGMLAHQVGDVDTAAELGRVALARGRRCGDLRARLLAGFLLRTVPLPSAGLQGLPKLVDLLPITEALREPRMESIILAAIARDRRASGDLGEATYWGARALEAARSIDAWHGTGFAIMFLADVAHARGDLDQAATLHGMVADRLEELSAYLPPWSAEHYAAVLADITGTIAPARLNERIHAGAVLPWHEATAAALAYAYRASSVLAEVQTVPATGRRGQHGSADDPGATPSATAASGGEPLGRAASGGPAEPRAAGHGPAAFQAGPAAELTPREQQVLELIAEGCDNRAIAERLRVSVNAVSHHASTILAKLSVDNRTQAAIWHLRRQIPGAPHDRRSTRPVDTP